MHSFYNRHTSPYPQKEGLVTISFSRNFVSVQIKAWKELPMDHTTPCVCVCVCVCMHIHKFTFCSFISLSVQLIETSKHGLPNCLFVCGMIPDDGFLLLPLWLETREREKKWNQCPSAAADQNILLLNRLTSVVSKPKPGLSLPLWLSLHQQHNMPHLRYDSSISMSNVN